MTDHDQHAHDDQQSKLLWNRLKPHRPMAMLMAVSNPIGEMDHALDSLKYGMSAALGVPMAMLYGRNTPPSADDMKVYYDQIIERQERYLALPES